LSIRVPILMAVDIRTLTLELLLLAVDTLRLLVSVDGSVVFTNVKPCVACLL